MQGGIFVALSEARTKANKKYHEKFDDIKVRVPKGCRQIWQDYAAANGESLNGFLSRAAIETMARDKKENLEF